jgi:hypothetical protein
VRIADPVGGDGETIFDQRNPQPIRIATSIGRCGNLRWPYQARVMKMFETMRRTMVSMCFL